MKKAVFAYFTILCLLSTMLLMGLASNIHPVEASGTIHIEADGTIDPSTAPISTADNNTYTFTDNINESIIVRRDNIVVDGTGYTLQGTGSGTGIILNGRGNVTIKNANIKNFEYGIWLRESSNNSISENNIQTNEQHGILLVHSSNNNISTNTMENNAYGIRLYYCTDNSIFRNNITYNLSFGINLESSSHNRIFRNNITKNGRYQPGSCPGIYLQQSKDNEIYHNNLVDNAPNASVQKMTTGSDGERVWHPNTWDDGYPSGGNYWSDYTGVDSNHDGIGDTPYIIDENNTDNYPFMGIFSDFNATSEYHVQTICNSTISDFQFNGTAIIFNVTGEDGTMGFCRTCIPTAVMNDTYTVLVNGTEVPFSLLPCSNSTHSYLYFSYSHSTQDVVIIPELPSVLIVPLLMTLTLGIAVLLKKRKLYMRKDSQLT